jgi:hypothetical protein
MLPHSDVWYKDKTIAFIKVMRISAAIDHRFAGVS